VRAKLSVSKNALCNNKDNAFGVLLQACNVQVTDYIPLFCIFT